MIDHTKAKTNRELLEAMANASNDFWCCPWDDEDNPQNYIYEPLRGR